MGGSQIKILNGYLEDSILASILKLFRKWGEIN
jgi:hypothetical protein